VTLGGVLTLFQQEKRQQDDPALLKNLQSFLSKYDKMSHATTIKEILNILLERREEARHQKDWKTADQIRSGLGEIGFEIQDTDKGPVWRKK